ncbi:MULTISPECIES: rod shape-determining protein [Treponema]|jgi:rod shape-determining protein MreB|uniref:Cell shape-determining protein MreB n=1 Tax=Treponema rectale TaxID=744512 RepID=A0A840SDP0_9SPIR|nr:MULTISPECIES: rod shape-determining protein [Treponema]MBB5218308.1 rod shape-determining protein MreB [Treponema rectale]MBE6353947.1 rod shape-determining protein [Treponema sp.]MBO6176206.1 rod shape-determining protein [Treponema sp.]MCR5217522.1 rod shape-determining protein [Treponema sp.]QOS39991.1 rod shape-determining protein [Treponema rectale]
MGFFDNFTTDIGIDLGTCNTLIYVRGQGIVIDEPSVVAVEKGTGKVVAVGSEAKRMLWKTPTNIVAIRPLADGVISDSISTEKMIKYFISKVIPKRHLFKSIRMKIGIPSCITQVERDAVMAAALKAGAKEVEVIEESLAAAIGAEIPIYEPAGHMVCDIGGGTTEVSVISLGGMVVTSSIRVGGNSFDEAIIKHIKNIHNLIIGQQMAERLKVEIGNAMADKTNDKMEVKGTDSITGLPRRIEVDSVEVREALKEPVSKIVEEIKKTLSRTPPELNADIVERGIIMSGGSSMLKNLTTLISKETGVPVTRVKKPLECVARGAGEAFELFKNMSSIRSVYDNLNN